MTNPSILFVCVHNSGRSQMAQALFNRMAAGRGFAESAGTLPGESINPVVHEAMLEIGINLEHQFPKIITQDMVDQADRAYTMGCAIDESCPATFIPSEDWGLDDPAGRSLDEVRKIRDEIVTRISSLIEELDIRS